MVSALRMLLEQKSVHRNEFLRNYLYSFRNRLSELSLRHGVHYRYDPGTESYTLLDKDKAKEVFDKLTGKKKKVVSPEEMPLFEGTTEALEQLTIC